MNRRCFLTVVGASGATLTLGVGCGGVSETNRHLPSSSSGRSHHQVASNAGISSSASADPEASVLSGEDASDSPVSLATDGGNAIFHVSTLPDGVRHDLRLPNQESLSYRLIILHDAPKFDSFASMMSDDILRIADESILAVFSPELSEQELFDAAEPVAIKAIESLIKENGVPPLQQGVTIVGVKFDTHRAPKDIHLYKGWPSMPFRNRRDDKPSR